MDNAWWIASQSSNTFDDTNNIRSIGTWDRPVVNWNLEREPPVNWNLRREPRSIGTWYANLQSIETWDAGLGQIETWTAKGSNFERRMRWCIQGQSKFGTRMWSICFWDTKPVFKALCTWLDGLSKPFLYFAGSENFSSISRTNVWFLFVTMDLRHVSQTGFHYSSARISISVTIQLR